MKDKILVVDDEESILKTIFNALTIEGYDVSTTSSSRDALEKVRSTFFDLILLDVRMPEMDGITLLKEIRKIQEGNNLSRVIIITAYANDETPINAIKLGADDYIMKPFELDNFLHSVSRNIRISRLEREKQEHMAKLEKIHEGYKNLVKSLTRVIWAKTKNKELEKKVEEVLKKYEDELR